MRMMTMTSLALAVAATAGVAAADGGQDGVQVVEQCFDKGSLTYFDCPTAAPAHVEPQEVYVIDEPVAPIGLTDYNWTGGYIGLHGGIGRAGYDGDFDSAAPDGPEANDVALRLGGLGGGGFTGGAQLGYQLHFVNDVVFGIEVDGSFVNTSGDIRNANGESASAELNYTASARARLGYSFGSVMPFLTAGVGAIGYEASVRDDSGSALTVEDTAFAPVVGGGLNFWVTDAIVAGAEVQYYFADSGTSLSGVTDADAGDEITLEDYWSARATIGFRF